MCNISTMLSVQLYFTAKEGWNRHPTTGEYYQLNTESALTQSQAQISCKQQGASLLSITDPHQQAYITGAYNLQGNRTALCQALTPKMSFFLLKHLLVVLLQNARRGCEDKLWIGQILDQEHGWHWSNGQPYRYMNWDSGGVFFSSS